MQLLEDFKFVHEIVLIDVKISFEKISKVVKIHTYLAQTPEIGCQNTVLVIFKHFRSSPKQQFAYKSKGSQLIWLYRQFDHIMAIDLCSKLPKILCSKANNKTFYKFCKAILQFFRNDRQNMRNLSLDLKIVKNTTQFGKQFKFVC